MRSITASTVGDIRAGFSAKRHKQIGQALAGAKFTLSSLLELAAWMSDPQNNDVDACELVDACFAPETRPIIQVVEGSKTGAIALTANGQAEVSSVSDLTSADKGWLEFVMRFSEALVRAGYEKSYARALAFSFHEMGDNVRQHATAQVSGVTPSAACWHVVGDVAAFAVVDLGRGVRASLQTNATWAGLKSDQDALLAVLRDHATRKAENKFGDGYREVVHNFVSRNGCLAVRSGTCEVTAIGSVVDGSIKAAAHPSFGGTRVAAWCAPNRPQLPPEPAF